MRKGKRSKVKGKREKLKKGQRAKGKGHSFLPFTFFLLLPFSFYLLPSSEAAVVSSQELIEHAERYDSQTVVYVGEVIGDRLAAAADGYVWINVHDGNGALGIFCPRELADQIEHQGSYKTTGDKLSIRGVFHRSCLQHGGDTDIHADRISIIQSGEQRVYPLEPQKRSLSIILPAIALALAIIYLSIRARFSARSRDGSA